MGCIYFIEAGDRAAIKIGRSTSKMTVNGRLQCLQLGNHLPLKLIRTIPGDFWQEKWIHLYFSDYKLRSEWFSFAPEMLTITPPPDPLTLKTRHDLTLIRRRAAKKAWAAIQGMRRRKCAECGVHYVVPPARICEGCQAYREHTGES